jgi:hypothetical protein
MKMETKYSFETLLTFSSGIKNKLSKIPAWRWGRNVPLKLCWLFLLGLRTS